MWWRVCVCVLGCWCVNVWVSGGELEPTRFVGQALPEAPFGGLCSYHSMPWTMLPWHCSKVASMALTMWCFYGLDYAFAYACVNAASMGHHTWYLVPCNELFLMLSCLDLGAVSLAGRRAEGSPSTCRLSPPRSMPCGTTRCLPEEHALQRRMPPPPIHQTCKQTHVFFCGWAYKFPVEGSGFCSRTRQSSGR
jgi:hypothetical protein